MSEDKMREVDATAIERRIVAGEIEAARMHGEGVAQSIQGLLEQLREYKKGATFWHTAYLELSDIKDAEIAARDLMIKDLREAVQHAQKQPYPFGHLELFEKALANSEHHNSRALENMLLAAEIAVLKESTGSIANIRMIVEREAKLAELNKE